MSKSALPPPSPDLAPGTGLPPPKPGWKTTELWITLAVQVVAVLLDSGVLGEGRLALAAGALLHVAGLFGYVAARTVAKKAHEAARAAVRVETLRTLEDMSPEEKAAWLERLAA
jgi:hypothetical protein